MTKILGIQQAIPLSIQLQKEQKRIVLAGGCFDLLHKGHESFLQEAKAQGDHLFILLESDAMIKKRKGKDRPFESESKRAERLSQNKNVSFIIILPEKMTDEDYDELVSEIKPAIIATTEGDPYRSHKERQAKNVNAQVIDVVKRLPEFSTTKISRNNYEI